VKLSDVGVAVSVPALTTNCTLTVAGLPPAAAVSEVTVTVPVYVPGASVPPLAVTVIEPGVVPLAGVMVSQLPLPLVAVAADQLSGCPLLETAMVCAAGAAPPAVCVKESVAGVTDSTPEVTVKVTGMVMGLLATGAPLGLVAVMVMLPL